MICSITEEEFDTASAGEKEAEVGEDSGRREKEKGEYEKSMVSTTKLKSNFAINEVHEHVCADRQ